jgi:hypothetical protein
MKQVQNLLFGIDGFVFRQHHVQRRGDKAMKNVVE